jgi:hypothetical protein
VTAASRRYSFDMRQEPLFHEHTAACFAANASGPLAYTPCRADKRDRNLLNMNSADLPIITATWYRTGRTPGLTPVCRHYGTVRT